MSFHTLIGDQGIQGPTGAAGEKGADGTEYTKMLHYLSSQNLSEMFSKP